MHAESMLDPSVIHTVFQPATAWATDGRIQKTLACDDLGAHDSMCGSHWKMLVLDQ